MRTRTIDMFWNILGYTILALIIIGIGYAVYYFAFVHVDKYHAIDAVVIGHFNKGGSKQLGGAANTHCIMEDENGTRYTTIRVCSYLEGDEVSIKFKNGRQYNTIRLE